MATSHALGDPELDDVRVGDEQGSPDAETAQVEPGLLRGARSEDDRVRLEGEDGLVHVTRSSSACQRSRPTSSFRSPKGMTRSSASRVVPSWRSVLAISRAD